MLRPCSTLSIATSQRVEPAFSCAVPCPRPVPGQWQYTPDPNVTWAPVTNPYSTGHFFEWGTGYSITTSGTIKLDNMATTPTNIIENSNSSSDYVNYTSNLIDYEKI